MCSIQFNSQDDNYLLNSINEVLKLTRAQQCLSPQALCEQFLSLKSSSPSRPFQVTVPISDRLWLFPGYFRVDLTWSATHYE